MKKIKFLTIATFLGIYLISAGASWAIFSFIKSEPSLSNLGGDLDSKRSKISEDLPKTAECPINGKMYTEIEKDIWKTRRPITAIIENHEDARPLAGISKADVVYEAVAEGGITRLLNVFYCGVAAEDVEIAPVRSARIYFINWAAGYGANPIFTHVGGANNLCPTCPGGVKYRGQVDERVMAIEELADLGWRVPGGNDFDTTYDLGFPVFWRDPERLGHPVATEHTMVASTDKIYDEADSRGFNYKKDGVAWDKNFEPWSFKDGSPAGSPDASEISFEFWSNAPLYDVTWTYDSSTNSYLRSNGGQKFVDHFYDDAQISAQNVVVMFVDEEGPVDTEKHMFYESVGEGDALYFQNGEVIEGSWSKDDQTSRIEFVDSNGKEVSFVRGTIWIEAVPDGNDIDYN